MKKVIMILIALGILGSYSTVRLPFVKEAGARTITRIDLGGGITSCMDSDGGSWTEIEL